MSDYPVTRGSRSGDPHPTLRLVALTAVIVGVVLVAGAAFLLSYNGIHQIALQAGVSPGLARLYPLMFDAMLVISCAAALALRNAGWGAKCYVWVSLLLLVCAVAVGDALHATGVRLDGQAARAVIAIIPWVLLLMGFVMWLVMLRQWRRARAAAAANGTAVAGSAAAGAAAAGSAAGAGAVTWAGGRDAPLARSGSSRDGMDTLLERPAGRAPDRPSATEGPAAGERAAAKDQPARQRRTGAPDERQPAATAAGKGQDGGHEGGSGDRNGDADQAGNGTARVGGRDMPAGAVAEGSTTFEALPAGAAGPGGAARPAGLAGAAGTAGAAGAVSAAGAAGTAAAAEPGAAAGSAAAGADSPTLELSTQAEGGDQAEDDDHAEPPPPMPAPAPLPLFDRLRSTPTPPQETGASGE